MSPPGTKRQREGSLEEDIEASHKRLRDFKQTHLAHNDEIKKFDEAIRQLEKKREEAVSAQETFQAELLDAAIRPYSQAWNLCFATKILRRLPLELREMIWRNIWSYAYVLETRPSMGCTLQGEEGCLVPHVVDPAYVGPEVALEVVQAYYQHAPIFFRFYHVFNADGPRDIERLLHEDVFHVNLDPKTVLRTMDISLDLDKHTMDDLVNSSVVRAYQSLLTIVKKKGFMLDITLVQKRVRLNVWPKFLDMLRPILTAFETGGAKVNIKWAYIQGDFPVERALNDIIKHPDLDWKDKMSTSLDAEEELDDNHREYKFEDASDYDPRYFATDSEFDDDISTESLYSAFDSYMHGSFCTCGMCYNDGDFDLDEVDFPDTA